MIVAKVPAGIYATRSCHVEISVVGLKTTCPEIYTLKDPWIRKADVPHKNYTRYGATAFSINGFGYAGLGYNFAGSNFWKYDPQANKWSEIAPFPGSNRMRAAGFVIRNMAYVGLGGTNLHDFWRYDPEINIWTRISDFPADNTGNVSLSLNNKGYVITSEATSNFWEYDAVTDTWTKKKDFPRSTSVYPFYPDAGFCINGKIYIYATDRSTGSDQLWEYDFSTDSWTRKADLTDSYLDIYTTGYSLNGKGYIRGNYYLFEYDPLLNSWSTVPQNKDVPGLFNFRKQSIAFLIGNLLYFGTSSDGWGTGDYLYDFWEFDSNYK
jgi:N-acetylneuraminic acid mutarotase